MADAIRITGGYFVMDAMQQRILGIIAAAPSYVSEWHICDQLQVSRSMIGCQIPYTEYDEALHALLDTGYIEEVPDLGCRYRLKR